LVGLTPRKGFNIAMLINFPDLSCKINLFLRFTSE